MGSAHFWAQSAVSTVGTLSSTIVKPSPTTEQFFCVDRAWFGDSLDLQFRLVLFLSDDVGQASTIFSSAHDVNTEHLTARTTDAFFLGSRTFDHPVPARWSKAPRLK